jgi:hypothetical protein
LWQGDLPRHAGRVPLAVFRGIAAAVFVTGIAGMIIGSLADNNNGVVVTFGLITVLAAVVLMSVAFTTRVLTEEQRAAAARAERAPAASASTGAFDEAAAAAVEDRVQSLVRAGADESAVRELVGEAVRLGRSAGETRAVG